MDPLIQSAVVGGAFLLSPLLFGRWSGRWLLGLAVFLAAAVYAVQADGLDNAAVLRSLSGQPALLLMGWCLALHWLYQGPVTRLFSAPPTPAQSPGRPAAWVAGFPLGARVVLTAMLAGDVASALVWGSGLSDGRQRARVALTASAAGMLSPLGTASAFLMFDWPWRIPIGACLLLVAWPRADVSPQPLPNPRGLISLLVWVLLLGALASVVSGYGTPHLAQEGLVWLDQRVPYHLAAGWTLLGVLLAAVGTEEGAVVVATSVLGDCKAPGMAYANMALGSGMAVGGLAPLLVVGGLRAGWRMWARQIVVTILVTTALCMWRFA